MSRYKKANFLFLIFFSIIFGLFTYLIDWWPWIFAAAGLSLTIRQCFLGSYHDIAMTTFIFGGLTLFYLTGVNWDTLLPILMALSALYLLFKEWIAYKHHRTHHD